MRDRQSEKPETCALTCPVCGALPGTSCIEDDRELAEIHPSRQISIAERNYRRHASGWEPPELAERRRRAQAARAALFDPRLGPGVTAALAGHRPRNPIEPHRGPWSLNDPIQDVRRSPVDAGAAEAKASPDGRSADEDTWTWFAAYLAGFGDGAAVPRQILRDIANQRWPAAADGPMPPSRARQRRRRIEGRRGGSSKGRRSSHALTRHLRSFEELGLIRRDHARDMVIITDPGGLRRLADAPAHQRESKPAG